MCDITLPYLGCPTNGFSRKYYQTSWSSNSKGLQIFHCISYLRYQAEIIKEDLSQLDCKINFDKSYCATIFNCFWPFLTVLTVLTVHQTQTRGSIVGCMHNFSTYICPFRPKTLQNKNSFKEFDWVIDQQIHTTFKRHNRPMTCFI